MRVITMDYLKRAIPRHGWHRKVEQKDVGT
jgi:hypothetical protein